MEKLCDSETGCCQRFDPAPWDGKEVDFEGVHFIKDHVRSFMHIPLNFGRVMVRNMERIQKEGALADKPLLLSDEHSAWNSDIYIAVSKKVPGAEMAKVPGKFLSKVFEGEYRNMGKWVEEMEQFVKSKGKKMKKIYFFYTTCPKCARYYGKNYVVLFAEV
ncbi:MAG: hypothetical protein CVT48_02735 [Thermoplasmata archaeon HGW-Thermoplasmata-1]|nr:MAG: hypothetical protein CVT48_02735 [Thermoplasmata archaeon HGW-Thermoplasmata-1]